MRQLSNLHTHTQFDDGKATAEEMVQEAIRCGFVSLGFSGHSPLFFDSGYAMLDEGAYLAELSRLTSIYGDRIEIIPGIEWDYDTPRCLPVYRYAIGSVHQMIFEDRIYAVDFTREELLSCVEKEFHGDCLAYAKKYYELVVKSALRPEVDVVGHFDLLLKFGTDLFSGEAYEQIALEALSKILDKRPQVIFEYNTGGMYRVGLKEAYPASFLLKELQKRNARITITTDAHDTASLSYKAEEGMMLLKQMGFDEVWQIRSHGFEAVSL